MSTIASLMVKIGADISELEKGLSKVSRQVEDTGKRMTQMGKTISTRVTAPLTALAGVAVRSFGIQEKAELQLRAALQANGREVDHLFTRYNAFAKEMQRVTVVGDETTLAMLAQAESFGLSADNAERAVKNSIAMQSAFGVNAQSALRYTAALEEGNATMLTRYIPSLRDIKDDSERAAEAQRILGNAFSSAEAEAQGSTGQMIQMKNAIGDLMEDIGEIVSGAILPFVSRVKELAEQFQTLDKRTKTIVVAIGAATAAIGPLLIIFGQLTIAVGALIPVFATLTKTMMANPWIAAAVGVTALVGHIINAERKLRSFRGELESLFNLSAEGTEQEFDRVQKALERQNERIEEAKALHESMGVAGSEAAQVQIAALEAEKDKLLEVRNEISKKWVEAVDGAEKAVESNNAVADSYDRIATQAERVRVAARAVNDEIIDPLAIAEARILREEYDRFNNALYEVMTTAHDAGQALELPGESVDQVSRSFVGLEMVAGQALDRLVFAGEKLNDVLKSIVRQLASRAVMTALRMVAGGGISGIGGFFKSVIGVNDALITSGGDVVKFHPDDSILAMKDFGKLGGGHTTVTGVIRGQDILLSNARSERFFR